MDGNAPFAAAKQVDPEPPLVPIAAPEALPAERFPAQEHIQNRESLLGEGGVPVNRPIQRNIHRDPALGIPQGKQGVAVFQAQPKLFSGEQVIFLGVIAQNANRRAGLLEWVRILPHLADPQAKLFRGE